MKNYCRCIFACMAAGLILLAGCNDNSAISIAETGHTTAATASSKAADIIAWEPTQHETVNDLDGVAMILKENSASSTGLTVVFRNKSNKRCIFGEPFWLEKKIDGKWYDVPVSFTDNYAFTMIGYDLPPGTDREWTTDWEWLYGSLDAGEYRIVKDISDFRGPGDEDVYYLTAEFTIDNGGGSNRRNNVVEHGTVTFRPGEGGPEVKLPLFGITATYGVISGSTAPAAIPSSSLPEISFEIPEDQQDQLAAFWINQRGDGERGILLLGPRGWRPVEAGVGADGSVGILLENPDDPAERLLYSDTSGGCQGCAISGIATYFPSLRKWAEDQAFPGEEMKFRQQVLLSPRIISYSKEHADPGYEINGMAYQQHGRDGAWFRREEMSSAVSKHRLATTVLDFFVKQYDLSD